MWRRVAGGLNTPVQQQLWAKLKPALVGKGVRVPPSELAEMWRGAASFERLDQRVRQQLGEEVLRQLGRAAEQNQPAPPYAYWALARLGARRNLYGPLNTLVHPDAVARWLDMLRAAPPAAAADRANWAFTLANLARRTGLRGVDVPDAARAATADLLRTLPVPADWPAMVTDVTATDATAANRLFGDDLPIGLRVAG